MTAIIDEIQHPDFIWTWKSNARGSRSSIWLPYLHSIERTARKQWKATYSGGDLELELRKIDCIMLYGACGDLPVEFLDDLAKYRIPLMIHRRNLTQPYVFFPALSSDNVDVLSRQILARSNQTKRTYIARVLLKARLSNMRRLIPVPETTFRKLNSARNVAELRNIEHLGRATSDALGVYSKICVIHLVSD